MGNSIQNQSRVLLVSLLLLVGFLLVASLRSSLIGTDIAVNSWAVSIHMSSLTSIAVAISILFDYAVLLPASLLIAVAFFFRHNRKYAVLLLGAMGGITLLVESVKVLVHSARPLNGVILESGFSFPSGHVASTMVFFGLLTYFAWLHWKGYGSKALPCVFFVALEFSVGFSRVYLNVHWLSDVLGGSLLGLFWLIFSIFLFLHSEKYWPNKP